MHLNRCKWTTYEEFRIRQVPSAGNSRGLEVYHFQVRYISHIVPLRKHIEQILWCEWTNCLDDEDPMVIVRQASVPHANQSHLISSIEYAQIIAEALFLDFPK